MTFVSVNSLYFFASLTLMFWLGYARGYKAGWTKAVAACHAMFDNTLTEIMEGRDANK